MFMVVAGVLVTMMWTSAFAGGWSAKQVISNLKYSQDKTVVVFGLYGSWNNPNACDSDAAVVLDQEAMLDSYDELFAMLLGAHLTGREIKFFLSGCKMLGRNTIPVIKKVNIY
jgi:hypothetical protein